MRAPCIFGGCKGDRKTHSANDCPTKLALDKKSRAGTYRAGSEREREGKGSRKRKGGSSRKSERKGERKAERNVTFADDDDEDNELPTDCESRVVRRKLAKLGKRVQGRLARIKEQENEDESTDEEG